MRHEYGWTEVDEGGVLGAFFWGYIMTQVLGGWAAARWGGRNVLLVGVVLWSLFTLLTPLSASLGLWPLVCCRVLMGLGEGVTMPSTHSLIGTWVQKEERTRAVAATTSGQIFGTVLAMSSAPLADRSWPTVFYLFGLLGFVYALCLFRFVPAHAPAAAAAARQPARQRGQASGCAICREVCRDVHFLLRQRPMIAIIAAHVAHGYGWCECPTTPALGRSSR